MREVSDCCGEGTAIEVIGEVERSSTIDDETPLRNLISRCLKEYEYGPVQEKERSC